MYRKEKQRILAGGLNLLAPGDMTPTPDALRLENWRVDQVGALRSRKGLLQDTSGAGAPINCLFRIGQDRYGGGYGVLRTRYDLSIQVATGFDWSPLGFAAMQDYVWVMNRAKQVKVSGANAFSWGVDTPASAPTVHYPADAGTVEYDGDFTFFVTFITGDGHESGPSPGAGAHPHETQPYLRLDSIATPDPSSDVIARRIYGIGGGLNAALLFHEIHDITTTSFALDVTLEEVQNRNTVMPLDSDAPPAARGLLGPYLGRLIAWASDKHPNRLWWTPTAQPWAWPGAADESDGNWIDVGDEGEAILTATHHRSLLILYKERSIWFIPGDPDELGVVPERANATFGVLGQQAACSAAENDYFASHEGIYRFNGDYAEKVSVSIDPIFKGDWVQLNDDVSAVPLDQQWADASVLAYREGKLYFSYPESGTFINTVTLVYEESSQRWSHHRTEDHISAGGFNTIYNEGTGPGHALLGTGAARSLYQLNQGETDAGYAIPVVFQSKFLDQGLPDNDKIYADLVVDYRTAISGQIPSTLTVKLIYDNGTVEAIGSLISSERTTIVFPLGTNGRGRKGRNAAVLIEGNATSTIIINAVYLHWYAEARWAKQFDTGVVDLGKVNQLDEVEFDITALGTVNWALRTDLPGGTMAERATSSFAATADRATVPVRFTVAEGRRARLVVWSDAEFQLHGIRLRTKEIGEYIDGAQGDYWESAPVG